MFMKLGQNLDSLLHALKKWFLGTWIYKVRMYLGIKKLIKNNRFENDEHFNIVLTHAGYKQLYLDHFYKLMSMYYKDEEKVLEFRIKAFEKWREVDKRSE